MTTAKKRNYPDFIKAYMEYASYSEAPEMFHFWTAVSIVAGATRRKTWIDQGYFEWVANFYIIFVAPPGVVQKSTTVAIGMSLLRQVPKIHFGPEAITWQALVQCMAKARQKISDPKTGKITEMSAITISSGEFGTLLDPTDREMVDVLVSLWDGRREPWEKKTKTQGSDVIENPWLNIIGCTTPSWIAGNFPDYLIGGGFTSRAIFVYADKKRQLVAYPKKVMPKGHLDKKKKLVEDLTIIASLCGEMTLTDEAEIWGEKWYENFQTNRPAHLKQPFFEGYINRKQTHIHKLAMVLSLSQGADLLIEKKHLKCAETILTALEYDVPKVFSKIGQTTQSKNQGHLEEVMRLMCPITTKALYRKMRRQISVWEYENSLKGLVAAGKISVKLIDKEQMLIWNK